MAAPEASVHPVGSRLYYHFFLQQTKVVSKVFQKGECCLEGLINLACGLQLQMLATEAAPNASYRGWPFYERFRMVPHVT